MEAQGVPHPVCIGNSSGRNCRSGKGYSVNLGSKDWGVAVPSNGGPGGGGFKVRGGRCQMRAADTPGPGPGAVGGSVRDR